MARLVLVTGDKGGVGKSFTSRTLLDWYLTEGKTVRAFDTDKTNSTFFRFYQEEGSVRQLDVESPGDLDELVNLLGGLSATKSDEVILVDCAARTLDSFLKWMREVGFLDLKRELGFDMTLAFVLGPEKDCITILKDVSQQFGAAVEYVIIKNMAKSSNFALYENSNTRKLLLEKFEASEIELPVLLEKTTLLLDKYNLGFTRAIRHESVQLADQSRIKTYRKRTGDAFTETGAKWL